MLTIGVRARRGVVQIREPVAESGPEMQQRRRGPALVHASVPVGGPGRDTFEQREDRAHLGHVVERGDEVHLRRARVREAGIDAVRDERPEQRVRTVHDVGLLHSVEEGSGIQDAVRVERGLDPAHQRDLLGILELEEVLLLLRADPVLRRDRAAHPDAGRDDRVHHAVADLVVGLEDGEMDVAVARMTRGADERRVLGRDRGDRLQVLRHRRRGEPRRR